MNDTIKFLEEKTGVKFPDVRDCVSCYNFSTDRSCYACDRGDGWLPSDTYILSMPFAVILIGIGCLAIMTKH